MIALVLALVLDCKPVELVPFTATGFSKHRSIKVAVTKKTITALDGTAVLWSDPQPPFAVMISEDDSWVAMKGPYPIGSIRIAPTKAGAKLVVVDPLEHLSPEERKLVPETSCGTSWFKGWRNTPHRLTLEIDQGAQPPLLLKVSPDGKVAR